MGDATNLVIIFAGELLKKAEHLIVMGLHPNDVIQGYELACAKALSELDREHSLLLMDAPSLTLVLELSTSSLPSPVTVSSLQRAIKPVISSKQYGNEEILSKLVAEAAMIVMPAKYDFTFPLDTVSILLFRQANFNVDNVRVVKIMGGSFSGSTIINGMVFNREPEGIYTYTPPCFFL